MKRSAQSSSSQRPAKRQKSQLAMTQEIVRKELRKKTNYKYTDNAAINAGVNANGTLTTLFQYISRGDRGFDSFDGNMIFPQAITAMYYFHTNQSYNVVRFMIFQWFESAAPTLGGVLQQTDPGLAVISPITVTNKSFIKVLYDKTHTIYPSDVNGQAVSDAVKVYIPGKKLRPVRFPTDSNTPQYGNIYVLVVSDDQLTTFPGVYWHTRVTFSDE